MQALAQRTTYKVPTNVSPTQEDAFFAYMNGWAKARIEEACAASGLTHDELMRDWNFEIKLGWPPDDEGNVTMEGYFVSRELKPKQPHTYGLGTRVTFEDPTSGWVDYVTGEIVERLDTGEYRIRIDGRETVVTLPGWALAALDAGESGVVES
jgi:hypothetical protein